MIEKKRIGRPPGSLSRNRKGAETITLRLAQDCREIVDGMVPQAYPTRTAAIEALIRKGAQAPMTIELSFDNHQEQAAIEALMRKGGAR